MSKISKILVPVDLSSCSRTALDYALSLGAELGAKIQVLYVTDLPRFRAEPRVAVSGGSVTLREYALGEARAELGAFLEQLDAAQRARITTAVEAGSPRDGILAHAKSEGSDLIVMGTHGRTGRVHALAGSVAESVVRMASCPVLTVRDAG
jgi:nucleotide-binding universal stress UspA family protein